MPEHPVKVSIVVPTYNERENIPLLCTGIREALAGSWDYEVLVVDDNSPDGTAEAVRAAAAQDSRVRLLERPGKMGLGSAIVEGFRAASGDYWVMMDADLSHRPEDLPTLLNALPDADIVVGSRYVPGGGVRNWPVSRLLVSKAASAVGRLLVGLKVRDITSGFAAFRKESLAPLLPTLNPKGFKLLLEVLAKAEGARVKEVPIIFVDRRYGRSKFGTREVLTFLRLCMELRRARRRSLAGLR
ncbi:MAG: polyprenol monophosphomannose synthase [Chloroflexi bacterium]|nr:polyprenol monophosphomannose synthase [Chloroflexota bacterium]